MATDNFWGKFRRWRRHRPFWGGLFLILSAGEMFLSANMAIGGMEVHLGPQGFLSYVLPLILLICGLLIWFTPAQRLFYGIVALLAALYSFIGLNLGGFGIGMLLGILGGGLAIAWGPPRNRPGVQGAGAPPTGEPSDHDNDPHGDDDYPHGDDDYPAAGHDLDETQHIPIAGHDDRPHERPVRPATLNDAIVPGFPQHAAPRSGVERLGKNPKAMVIALIPVAVTATILAAGSNLPASAEECPEGLPSISTSAKASSAAATTAAATTAAATTAAAAAEKTSTAASSSKEAAATASASGSAAPSASSDSSDNSIVEGIEEFFDGLGNLLGINGEESSSPSASPSPSETTSESPSAAPEPTATATSEDAEPTKAASSTAGQSASAQPSASDSEIPCLGARIYGKVASADDIPYVSAKPGVMKVDSLTMYNSTYDGVVEMPIAGGGTFKALKFSMDKAVNKPFNLTIAEAGNAQTVITSDELTTTGTVKFYTPSFKGNLFGLIPVTFTPDSPPPLTLPVLWFTNVEIQLAYVRSDVLTGKPLNINEKF